MERHGFFIFGTLGGISLLALHMALAAPAFASPQGGKVVGGSAHISERGKTLDIRQHSDRAVIDWRSFDINADEHTRFLQPSNRSVTLNRVTGGGNESRILGKLSANGTVMLVNPNGVVFGKNAKVDVNGLVATTADIENRDFMRGNFRFDKPGNPNASVVNNGAITARDAGLVGLVAPNVVNNGVIEANLGHVHLASGDRMAVDLYGDGLLDVAVSDAMQQQLVQNSGTITTQGGTIALTAAAGRNIVDSLVKVDGELRAPSARAENGKIIIGSLDASAPTQATTLVSGTVQASGGGDISITGKRVALLKGATVDVSGNKSGGSVKVGGDYLGQGDTQRAEQTYIDKDSIIRANGGKGRVIVWSDEYTRFDGTIEAQGGNGFVETSSENNLQAFGTVKAHNGQWLLDPGNITINGAGPTDTVDTDGPIFEAPVGTDAVVMSSAIESALFGTNGTDGADVTIRTGRAGGGTGAIFVGDDIQYTGTAERSLTLQAYSNIIMNGRTIESQNAPLNLTLNSRYNGVSNEGYIRVLNSTINTNGGDLLLGGGAGAAGFAMSAPTLSAIVVLNSDIDTAGGSIIMRGQQGVGANDTKGVYILGGSSIDSGTGDISIEGRAGSGSGSMSNVIIDTASITTTSGDITITGTGGASSNSDASGVVILGGTTINSTANAGPVGDIHITGTGGTGTTNFVHGIELFAGHINSGIADIYLNGTTADNDSHGLYIRNGATINSTVAAGGTIELTARSDNHTDLNIDSAGTIGSATTQKDITFITDDFAIAASSVQTDGTIAIENRSAGRTVGVGAGAGQLTVSDASLAMLDGNGYSFGSSTSGNVTVNSAYNFGDNNVSFISGDTLTLSNPITHAASATPSFILLQAENDMALSVGGTWNLANNRNLHVQTVTGDLDPFAGATVITTQGTGSILFSAGNDLFVNHALTLNATGTGNVTLTAADDIVAAASLDYNSANPYALLAEGDISNDISITNSGAGTLILAAGWDGATGLDTDSSAATFGAVDVSAVRGVIGATGNISGTGTLTADTLELDAGQDITSEISADNVDIGLNATSATLTGVVGGSSDQAAADAILGGPGSDPAYTFEGFIIRYVAAPGGGGGSGGGNPPPTGPGTPNPPVPPVPPVDNGGNGDTPSAENLPNTVVYVSQHGMMNSTLAEKQPDFTEEKELENSDPATSRKTARPSGLQGLLRINKKLAEFLGYTDS